MPSLRTIWDREVCSTFRTYEFHPRDGKTFGMRPWALFLESGARNTGAGTALTHT